MGMRLYTELGATSLPELIVYKKQPYTHVGVYIVHRSKFNTISADKELKMLLLKQKALGFMPVGPIYSKVQLICR